MALSQVGDGTKGRDERGDDFRRGWLDTDVVR